MVKELSNSDFNSEVLTGQNLPVLVDFWAPWCGPCRMMAPVLEQLSVQYQGKVKVAKINTDENAEISAKFQITGIPCLILFQNGKEVQRFVGFRSAPELAVLIDKAIA